MASKHTSMVEVSAATAIARLAKGRWVDGWIGGFGEIATIATMENASGPYVRGHLAPGTSNGNHLSSTPTCHANMKLWTPLFLFFSVLSGVLAAKPAADKFEKFQSLSRSAPVELDSASFDELTTSPRDYYTAVILTARDARYGCLMCREFDSEWGLISRSWNKGPKLDGLKMIYGTLDFDHGRSIFQKVHSDPRPILSFFHPMGYR